MSLISNAHTVGIIPPLTTTLAQAAVAMPSRTWIEFNGTTQNGLVCPIPSGLGTIAGNGQGSASPSTVYANKANWNPISKCIEVIGRYHGTGVSAKYARYREATHDFDVRYYTDASSINHNFDMNTVNEVTGDVYVKPYNSGSIARFASGGDMRAAELSPLTTVPSHPTNSINNGIDWWSGSGAIVRGGAQGVLVVLENDDPASWIRTYEPIGGTWAAISVPGVPASGPQYNGLLVYSRVKNVAVFCIGHKDNHQLWRINSNGTITKYGTQAPVYVHHTGANIVADPVTGNFLVSGSYNGSFYEFNPDGANGTWTNLNTGPVAGRLPSNVNWNTDGNGFPGITVTSLYEHGVVCYLSSDGGGNANMHLYKHS